MIKLNDNITIKDYLDGIRKICSVANIEIEHTKVNLENIPQPNNFYILKRLNIPNIDRFFLSLDNEKDGIVFKLYDEVRYKLEKNKLEDPKILVLDESVENIGIYKSSSLFLMFKFALWAYNFSDSCFVLNDYSNYFHKVRTVFNKIIKTKSDYNKIYFSSDNSCYVALEYLKQKMHFVCNSNETLNFYKENLELNNVSSRSISQKNIETIEINKKKVPVNLELEEELNINKDEVIAFAEKIIEKINESLILKLKEDIAKEIKEASFSQLKVSNEPFSINRFSQSLELQELDFFNIDEFNMIFISDHLYKDNSISIQLNQDFSIIDISLL